MAERSCSWPPGSAPPPAPPSPSPGPPGLSTRGAAARGDPEPGGRGPGPWEPAASCRPSRGASPSSARTALPARPARLHPRPAPPAHTALRAPGVRPGRSPPRARPRPASPGDPTGGWAGNGGRTAPSLPPRGRGHGEEVSKQRGRSPLVPNVHRSPCPLWNAVHAWNSLDVPNDPPWATAAPSSAVRTSGPDTLGSSLRATRREAVAPPRSWEER